MMAGGGSVGSWRNSGGTSRGRCGGVVGGCGIVGCGIVAGVVTDAVVVARIVARIVAGIGATGVGNVFGGI